MLKLMFECGNMKNIAVLVHNFTVEYSITILEGIVDFFRDKDVRLLIGQLKNPFYHTEFFDYQCWTCKEILLSDQIDAVISISGEFIAVMDVETLAEPLKKFKNGPIVSIGVDLGLPNSHYINLNCSDAYDTIIEKLIEQDSCKKVAIFTPKDSKSPEIINRLEVLKTSLKNHNICISDENIYHSELITEFAYSHTKENFSSKDDVYFDTLFAINDHIAIGCIQALQDLGLNIPNDVKVIGFDGTIYSENLKPSLTTIDQHIFSLGKEAGKIVEQIFNDKKVNKLIEFKCNPIFRDSTGKIPQNINEDLFKNENICSISEERLKYLQKSSPERYLSYLSDIDTMDTLFDMSKSVNTLQQLCHSLPLFLEKAQISSMAVCFYDRQFFIQKEDAFELPETALVSMFVNCDKENPTKIFDPNKKINPKENFLPCDYFDSIKGNFIIQPIFSGAINYGYLVCKVNSERFFSYTIILKILINSIVQAYEYTNSLYVNEKLTEQNLLLQQTNSQLFYQSNTDELTHLINRRAFFERGQQAINFNIDAKLEGLVLFIDMDKLKNINDTYGHKTGDRAIRAVSQILTKGLRGNDIVGRLSGDEFAVVAPGMKLNHLTKLRTKFEKLCNNISSDKGFPFVVSFSIGAVEFNKDNFDLQKLLVLADKELYNEKRIKHQQN